MSDIDLGGFSPADVKPSEGGGGVVPAGIYKAIVTSTEKKATKAGDGYYMNLKMQIVEGGEKGRFVYDLFNLWNKSSVAKKIAEETLSSLCHAMGHLQPLSKAAELQGKPFYLRVGLEEYNSKPKNVVQAYLWKPEDMKGLPKPDAPVVPATPGEGKAPWM